ncbi:hypothetical protein SS50377_27918 [Spironucleus salmonicida]|uniref:Uncharacterized protein n=1 Tax=Spironucleus salmonicida TaxID=348837 RepID=V6LP23_9EUKA|nr:hypothetical protein SS50377_27918 [Spironucleus salmonicida]|eukprot:EST42479.1 Hypothetical protein SS50377_17785 [Spironucleus salmonicida]
MMKQKILALLKVQNSEPFIYFLNQKQFSKPTQSIRNFDFNTLQTKFVASFLPLQNPRIEQLITDIAHENFDNLEVFNLLKVILGIKIYKPFKLQQADSSILLNKSTQPTVLKLIYNQTNLYKNFQINNLIETKFFQPFTAYNPLVQATFTKYIALQHAHITDQFSYLDIIQLQETGKKLAYLTNLDIIIASSLQLIKTCRINDITSQCIQELVESSLRQFLILKINSLKAVLNSSNVENEFSKFTLFEREIFTKAHSKSMFVSIFQQFHLAYHFVFLASLTNSSHLKLAFLEILNSIINIYQYNSTNLEFLQEKIKNSFDLDIEFSLQNLLEKSINFNANQYEIAFNSRQKELQKQKIYKEMLDNCQLVQKQKLVENTLLYNQNIYNRLQNFDLKLDRNLVEKVEISLGFQCDKETVLDLIEEMRGEFYQKISQNEADFLVILKKSAPHLLKLYYENNEKGVENQIQSEIQNPQNSQSAEIEEMNISDLIPTEFDPKQHVQIENEMGLPSTFHSFSASFHSIQKTQISAPGIEIPALTPQDFFFNNAILVEFVAIPIRKMREILNFCLGTFCQKQNFLASLLPFLDFYFCQNSLLISEFLETNEIPIQFRFSTPFSKFLACVISPVQAELLAAFGLLMPLASRVHQADRLALKLKRQTLRRDRIANFALWRLRLALSGAFQAGVLVCAEAVARVRDAAGADFLAFFDALRAEVKRAVAGLQGHRTLLGRADAALAEVAAYLVETDEGALARHVVALKRACNQ